MLHIPYQIYRDGELDFTEEKDFVISGFVEEETGEDQKAYFAFVSEAFLKNKIPAEQILYRFLFLVQGSDNMNTDEIEENINALAERFGIEENAVRTNTEYLWANYVDPTFMPAIVGIMLIVVLAGIITIYSIYYVSMGERIREFGKMKAIGAMKRQIRQIVVREGLVVALIAIPIGLAAGTVLSKAVFLGMMKLYNNGNIMVTTMGRMLQLEGVFYTIGTLVLSVGGGSVLGYPVFLWAKQKGMLDISKYHYPVAAAIVITVVLVVVQIILASALSKSVKKESLIDRIRFSE